MTSPYRKKGPVGSSTVYVVSYSVSISTPALFTREELRVKTDLSDLPWAQTVAEPGFELRCSASKGSIFPLPHILGREYHI